MIIASTVTVIKDDGTRVLTNSVEPGDNIVGGTYDDVVKANTVPITDRKGWTRFGIGIETHPTAAAPVVDSVLHDDKPDADASKKEWWDYAKSLGFGATDYEHTSKARLINLYGNLDPKGVIGA